MAVKMEIERERMERGESSIWHMSASWLGQGLFNQLGHHAGSAGNRLLLWKLAISSVVVALTMTSTDCAYPHRRMARLSWPWRYGLYEKPVKRTEWRQNVEKMMMDHASVCVTALQWVTDGRRKRGRPRATWRRTVEKESSTLGWRSWAQAPMVWNLLPDSLRDPTLSISNFRSTLKTHLFVAQRDT